MTRTPEHIARVLVLAAPLLLGGCLARTAVGIAGKTVETGVKVTGAAAGAVIDVATPDSKKGDEKEKSPEPQ